MPNRVPLFDNFTIASNGLIFAIAALAVWYAGTRMSRYAKLISDRLGGEQTMVGTLLLGGIVSLPEGTVAVSAGLLGNASLATHTLLGGIAITLVILAVVDAIMGPEPISTDVSHPVILLQGVLVILFLSVVAGGMAIGDPPIPRTGVGFFATLVFVLYFCALGLTKRYERSDPWIPKHLQAAASKPVKEYPIRISNGTLAVKTIMACVAIMIAGVFLAGTGDALSRQTGLGPGLFGLVLGGIATSLPELSTALAAVRLRQFEMAFADVFGTNLFSIMLLFLTDLAYSGPPILNEAGRFSLFSVILCIALTGIYLAGLLLRRNYSLLRMGLDSILVLLVYFSGIVALALTSS